MLRNILSGVAVALVGFLIEQGMRVFPQWDQAAHIVFLAVVGGLVVWLRMALDQARALAVTDALTGAPNRRAFISAAERAIHVMRRHDEAFTVAYIDVDGFKQINDRFGHAAGDRVLRCVAETLGRTVRAEDTYARIGGDEFAILLQGDRPGALLARVRGELAQAVQSHGWDVRFSVGAVTFRAPPESAEAVLRQGDLAMYEAKEHGNRLVHRLA